MLERVGRDVGRRIWRFAAYAIALDLTVVTADAAFEHIGVRRENWLL